MIFEFVRIRDFRNLEAVDISFSPRLNVLIGENGQGKTNILESLFLLTQGDSFKYSDNETLINQNSNQAFLSARVSQNDLNYQIKMNLLKTRKQTFLNEKRVTAADIRRIFAAVIFSPESLSAIKEGADERRQLVDELLSSFDRQNNELIVDFKKALKTRNKILKNSVEGISTRESTILLLESLEPSFLRLATELTYKRIKALNELLRDFNQAMRYISGVNSSEITIQYVVSSEDAMSYSKQDVYNSLEKRINQLRDAELSSGTSLVGPQKHDIVFLYNQKDSRFFCSQGQQRAIILSFKMAQIVYHRKAYGVYPVLMLDDVLSELDKAKRDALITFLHEINTQIFVTTTDFNLPESFSLDQISVMNVKNGKVFS